MRLRDVKSILLSYLFLRFLFQILKKKASTRA